MKKIKDDVQIFNLLEKNNQDLKGLDEDNYFLFEMEDNLHLVLFTARGRHKGFSMFIAESYQRQTAELYELLFLLQEKAYKRADSKVIFKAIREIQTLIDSTEAKKMHFDAH